MTDTAFTVQTTIIENREGVPAKPFVAPLFHDSGALLKPGEAAEEALEAWPEGNFLVVQRDMSGEDASRMAAFTDIAKRKGQVIAEADSFDVLDAQSDVLAPGVIDYLAPILVAAVEVHGSWLTGGPDEVDLRGMKTSERVAALRKMPFAAMKYAASEILKTLNGPLALKKVTKGTKAAA